MELEIGGKVFRSKILMKRYRCPTAYKSPYRFIIDLTNTFQHFNITC